MRAPHLQHFVPTLLALLGVCACATPHALRPDELTQVSKQRAQYVDQLAQFDAAQMQLGRLAMSRSDNLRVRAFGQELYDAHRQHLQALREWATAREQEASAARKINFGLGVGGSAPVLTAPDMPQDLQRYQAIGDAHEIDGGKALAGINQLEGTRFDRRLLRIIQGSQQDAHDLLVKGSRTYAADPVFASLLAQSEPLVASELQRTERLIRRVD